MRATSLRRAPQRRSNRTAGERTPLLPGACPHCFKVISVNAVGRRHAHLDQDGSPCTGGGIFTQDIQVDLTEIPPVVVGPERIEAALDRPHSYIDGRRVALHGRGLCEACRRELPLNSDGQIRRHRTRHQDPLAPYCSGVVA